MFLQMRFMFGLHVGSTDISDVKYVETCLPVTLLRCRTEKEMTKVLFGNGVTGTLKHYVSNFSQTSRQFFILLGPTCRT